MELVKLAAVFAAIIISLSVRVTWKGEKKKCPLSLAILIGSILGAVLYAIPPLRVLELAWHTISSWDTLSLCLITYMITFLQRMMTQKNRLVEAQQALSGIFNSRRVNASIAPILIGLLPSPAAAFIAGDMVTSSCKDYLDKEELAFVTSYFRHIPESCLPTYTSILLAVSLSGLSVAGFMGGMLLPVVVLVLLGYFYKLRKVPKDTGMPPVESKAREWLHLGRCLWPIALAIVLILAFNVSTYLAVLIALVLYFLLERFQFRSVIPYFASAFEMNIMLNTVLVMFFKNIIDETDVIALLPEAFGRLPLPTPMVFALIFFVGTIISGSNAIIAMCVPMAFATLPDGGIPLLVLLMSSTYIAMQMSPTHICLTLIAEYFDSNLSSLIKKTVPVIVGFLIFLIPYYYVLTLIF